jgi:hypothetical protein
MFTVVDYDGLGSLAVGGPSRGHRRRWAEVVDQLLAARHLPDDWDGQGSVAPEPAVVDRAISFALSKEEDGCTPPDFAIPTVNGTVVFEWHGLSEYVEFEVVSPDQIVRRTAPRGAGTV